MAVLRTHLREQRGPPCRLAASARLSALIIVGLGATPALAQSDVQAWGGFLASGTVRERLGVWAEGQIRVTNDIDHLGQRNLRLGLGWEASPDLSIYGGYAVFRNTPVEDSASSIEHRTWQQLLVTLHSSPKLRLIARTRTEQRWRENASGTSWRARQMLRGVMPLGKSGSPSAIVTSEVFFELEDTRWGVRSGLDQVRTFAGVGLPLKPGLSTEIGYLNQTLIGRDRPGPNHIAQITLVARF
ncbi:DUF2490 domain-containing protein [Sphingomonas sp. PB2P12]|uniref:DUF2490 domain-containing protein n=1 Tax=Sphingomonas sandaracina TaxID=3096157 RepID=UPI002FC72758